MGAPRPRRQGKCKGCGVKAPIYVNGRPYKEGDLQPHKGVLYCRECLCPDVPMHAVDFAHQQSSMQRWDEVETPPRFCAGDKFDEKCKEITGGNEKFRFGPQDLKGGGE